MLAPRALLVPSSPTLLIEEKRGNTTAMLDALAAEAARLSAERPDAIVVVTSRWSGDPAFLVDDGRKHTSLIDRPGFGVEPRYDCRGEPALARSILDQARRAGLHAATARRGADSGISVPLHFLAAPRFAAVVPASVGAAPAAAHRQWGAALRQAMTAWSGRAMLVVSGSLTFHEHSFNMKRESREDRELDLLAIEAMKSGEWSAIERRAARFPGKAHPETGWKHLEVLRGFLGEGPIGRLCAYETLPGIGEALVEFDLGVGSYEPAPDGIAPSPVRRAPVEPARRRTGIWRAPPAPGDPASPPRPAAPRSSAPRTPVRRPSSSRPFSPRPASSRPSSSRPFSPRPTSSRASSSRPPRTGPPRSGPPRSGASRTGPPRSGPPRSGASRSGPPRSGPSRSGPPRSGSPRPSGSGAFRAPRPGQPRGPRPSSRPPVRSSSRPSSRPYSSRPSSSRPSSPRPSPSRPATARPPRRRPAS